MASSKFLEEALSKTDVDESAVNDILGTLETQLVTSTTNVSQNSVHLSNLSNSLQINESVSASLIANGAPPLSTTQKHGAANGGGELLSSSSSMINNSSASSSGESVLNDNCVITNQQDLNKSINNQINNININNISVTSGGHNLPLSVQSSINHQLHGLGGTATSSFINNNQSTISSPSPSSMIAVSGQQQIPLSSNIRNPMSHSSIQQQQQQNLHNHQQQHHSMNINTLNNSSAQIMSKNNEPVKLVYPSQTGSQPIINMNNRVTFTSQSLPNGTINLSTLTTQPQQQQHHHQQHHQQQAIMQTSSSSTPMTVTSGTIKSTIAGQQQQPTLVIQKQNMVGTSMMPGVQIVNMRPGTPTTPAQQKTVATVSPRVVTHMVGARPTNSATLSALSNLQSAAGQPGQAILLKTENGQFQLLRVGPSPFAPGQSTNLTASNAGNQTIRLQTVPAAVSRFTGPPLALRKTIVSQQQQQQTITASVASSGPNLVVNSVSHAGQVHSQQQQHQQQQHHHQQQQNQQHHQQQQQQQPQQSVHNTVVVQTAPVMVTSSVAAPPIASVAPVPALTQQQTTSSPAVASTPANQNTKEKCRKFLANLLELSSREPKPVERNVQKLIQELIDANVQPEDFCDRLERLLNASPQPCLIGFLKKSLPLLRQSLVTKELSIEGIRPPPHNVAFPGSTITHIPAQVRPISQTTTIGQTQMRMVAQNVPRPIGQTTITRHTTPTRLQTPISATTSTSHRMVNASVAQVRPATTTIMQTATNMHQSTPPALQPVSATLTQSGFTPGGAQVRIRPPIVQQATRATAPLPVRQPATIVKQQKGPTVMKVGSTQIKQILPPSSTIINPIIMNNNNNNNNNMNMSNSTIHNTNSLCTIGNTIISNSSCTTPTIISNISTIGSINVSGNSIMSTPFPLPVTSTTLLNNMNHSSNVSTQSSIVATPSTTVASLPLHQQQSNPSQPIPIVMLPATKSTASHTTLPLAPVITSISPITSIPSTTSNSASLLASTISSVASGVIHQPPPLPTISTATSTTQQSFTKATSIKSLNSGQSSTKSTSKADKEKKISAAAASATSSSFYQQSMSSSVYGDDDINDVAAMGGVNLAEESQRILGSTEMIGTQIRSCKDEVFLHLPALQTKIRQIIAKHGLEEPSNEVAVLISHAAQERLKNIVEKLAVIAEHRIDIIKIDPRYEVTKDVRGQIKFLEELDKAEQKRHEEQEREMLMRAAKSRSKTEDPEQAKLKAKAKEMQRAEMEELRQRDANLTALQAIGPRKKPRLDSEAPTTSTTGGSGTSATSTVPTPLRPRIKRVNLKDMLFYLEQERDSNRSSMLYRAYLK